MNYTWKISKPDSLKNGALKKKKFLFRINFVHRIVCITLYNFKYIYFKLLLIYVMPSESMLANSRTRIVHVLFILFKLIVSLFSLKNVTPILRILSSSVRRDAVSTCVYYQSTYYT